MIHRDAGNRGQCMGKSAGIEQQQNGHILFRIRDQGPSPSISQTKTVYNTLKGDACSMLHLLVFAQHRQHVPRGRFCMQNAYIYAYIFRERECYVRNSARIWPTRVCAVLTELQNAWACCTYIARPTLWHCKRWECNLMSVQPILRAAAASMPPS